MKVNNETPVQFSQSKSSPQFGLTCQASRGQDWIRFTLSLRKRARPTRPRIPNQESRNTKHGTRNTQHVTCHPSPVTLSGHTLAEVMVAIGVIGFMLVSLYAGFSSGFALMRVARENLRATQILAERMEVVRLVRWQDLTPGFVPSTFTAPFYAADQKKASQGNFLYYGTVSNTPAPLSETYSNNVRMIQIELSWTNGIPRKRQMTTFVSSYGLQNYIY